MRMEVNIVFTIIHDRHLRDQIRKQKQKGEHGVRRPNLPHIPDKERYEQKNRPQDIARKKGCRNNILLWKELR